MMRIEPASIDQIRDVALRMRARDFDEFRALNFADTREALAEALAARYAARDDILCASRDGEDICVGGFLEHRPRVVSLMLYATDSFPRIGYGLTRFILREMFPRLAAAGIHRIEAISLADYSAVHEWLRTLGLGAETPPLRNFGKNGESFVQFAKVAHV